MFVVSKVTGEAVNLSFAHTLRMAMDGSPFVVLAVMPDGDHAMFSGSERECKAYITSMAVRLNVAAERSGDS